jgi:molybdopterin synthase catalytic subunit
VSVRLTSRPLDASLAVRELSAPECGAFVLFAGRVRPDRTRRGVVRALFYEADSTMALRALARIAAETGRREGVRRIVLWHRTGTLEVGETSVLVGAAADHRAQAFSAARSLIERVKHEAPIWKTDRLRPAPRVRRRRPG